MKWWKVMTSEVRSKSFTVAENIAPEIHESETVKWVNAKMLVCVCVCVLFFLQTVCQAPTFLKF